MTSGLARNLPRCLPRSVAVVGFSAYAEKLPKIEDESLRQRRHGFNIGASAAYRKTIADLFAFQTEEFHLSPVVDPTDARYPLAEAQSHCRRAHLRVFGLDCVDLLSGNVEAGLCLGCGEEDVAVVQLIGQVLRA